MGVVIRRWVLLVSGVVRIHIDFLIITYPDSTCISSFLQQHQGCCLFLCSFLNVFFFSLRAERAS